jgi:hypothetical protein
VRVLPAAAAAAARGGTLPAMVSGAWPDPQPRTCVDPVVAPGAPGPLPAAGLPPSGSSEPARGTPAPRRSIVQIAVDRATVTPRTRTLDVIARIGWRTSGTVGVELVAGGRRTRLRAPIGGHGGRVHLVRRIPASQARLGGGILTIRYAGDADTFAQTVRVRAARHSAQLKAVRPTLSAAGRIVARGTISRRARGVVHLELRFRDAAQPRAVRLQAKIADGARRLDERLPAPTRAAIAARSGPLQVAVLFTGDGDAGVAGQVRTFQLLGDR